MSAKDDATVSTPPPDRWTSTLALAVLLGAVVGATVALLLAPSSLPLFEARLAWTGDAPAAAEWPHPPAPGQSAVLTTNDRGLVLVVRAARAAELRELAVDLSQARAAGVVALAAARERLLARWRGAEPVRTDSSLDARGVTASLALARARMLSESARELPGPYAGPAARHVPQPPVPVLERYQELQLAAEAHDAPALERAMLAAALEEQRWFSAGVPSGAASAAERGAAWRRWQADRTDSMQVLAETLLAPLTSEARTAAEESVPARLAALSSRLPDPYEALVASTPRAGAPVPVPLPGAWARLLGLGAVLGGLVAGLAAFITRRLRGAAARVALASAPPRDPAEPGPWLHVVSGPGAAAITRAVLELSASMLARGERVLVVDGSPRLALHGRFGREARWGLMECLLADMPVLGLVQYGGRPGLYLLAHGNSQRGEGWARLGQRLDDARPHFGRVILALESNAPRAIGDALMGRPIEGWWAEPAERLPGSAVELSGRLGISFSPINMARIHEVSLEALAERIVELQPQLAPAPAEVAAVTAPPDPPQALRSAEPVILDCDLQVRQRLRFLAWMRRVQAEGRPEESLESIHS